jgi:CHASE3 domain sensor protein
MFKNKNRLLLFLGTVALLINGVFFWKANSTSGITYSEEHNQSVRNALAEINVSSG